MTEHTITATEDIRLGDFIRIDHYGEVRDVTITGWRHSVSGPLAQVVVGSAMSEYPPSKLKAGAVLVRGVKVAKVWRWAPENAHVEEPKPLELLEEKMEIIRAEVERVVAEEAERFWHGSTPDGAPAPEPAKKRSRKKAASKED